MIKTAKKFNVRVYGLLIENNKILLADEMIKGKRVTKFPGGGLEFGEGTIDCLIREFKEETGLDIKVVSHFYTTDYYVASLFNTHHQLLSIYYKVAKTDLNQQETLIEQTDYSMSDYIVGFRWQDISSIREDDVTFTIDKKVMSLLKAI
jgi:8-oxo-dGTP diphosphatase